MVAERTDPAQHSLPPKDPSDAMASTRSTSTEGSAQTPVRDPRAGEEQEEEVVTPISADGSTPPAEMSVQSPPASEVSGFGTEATDPDDESRPVTKQELTWFRSRAERHSSICTLMSWDS